MASRSELYRAADRIREELYIKGNEPLVGLAMAAYGSYGTETFTAPFKTESLCGLSSPGEPDIILLNRNKPENVQRFAMAHELIHTRLHRDKPCAFLLTDPLAGRDPVLEREANDGAAELLLPWREFILLMKDYRVSLGGNDYGAFCRAVCPGKHVSSQVAEIRVRELWHVMQVYLATGSLDKAEAALDDEPVAYTYGLNYERVPVWR